MADSNEMLETQAEEAPAERPQAPPIESRFLFVDVAAMRAKQLRRGALPRLKEEDLAGQKRTLHKPERIAMEEVKRGFVLYDLPDHPEAAAHA